MKKYLKSVRKFFPNLLIKYKIQLLFIACLFLLSFSSIIVINYLSRDYSKLLSQSLESSLSYSTSEINSRLNESNNLSYTMLSDSSLQHSLIAIKESLSHVVIFDAFTNVNNTIQAYYIDNRERTHISYISINTDKFSFSSSTRKANRLPADYRASIIQKAKNNRGSSMWITDYSQEYGLILARDIRRYENLQLDSLGVIIINIDLKSLLDSCISSTQNDPFCYLLSDINNSIMYNSMESSLKPSDYANLGNNAYKIIYSGGHYYFAISGGLEDFKWNYTIMVSYDRIHALMSNSKLISIFLILLSMSIISFFSEYIVNSITKHFGYLIFKMKLFATSNATIIDTKFDYSDRNDEIGQLNQQFDSMAHQVINLIQANYTYELLTKEAQIKALEAQINPHFLYNTLESINWRAKAIGEKDISLMAESLGHLFRAILRDSNEIFTICQELELVNDYLTIQKCRFDKRLYYEIDVNSNLLEAKTPKMIIQPLVENAISHAAENVVGQCKICISILSGDGNLQIYIKNTGSQFEDNLLEKLEANIIQPRGFGIGMLNVDQRIKLMFGEQYGLKLYNENLMAIAMITIPEQYN